MAGPFASIDQVLDRMYRCISGPAGSWQPEEERCLFWPDARMCRSGVDAQGLPWIKSMSFDDYVADVGPLLADNDFYEHETRRETSRFGNIAQVRSYYEARRRPDDALPLWRGINFVQLYNDGVRWWILSMAWDNERPGIETENTIFQ